MPPTCKHSTWPDNGIVSPVMQPFVQAIQVLPVVDFPTHAPVVVTLQIPCMQPTRARLTFLKSFVDLGVQATHLEKIVPQYAKPNSLQEWGRAVEEHVDAALRLVAQETGSTVTSLPHAYKGRCQPREPTQKPMFSGLKLGRNGEFTPPCELTSFGARLKLRQFRRLNSLKCQMEAHARDVRKWLKHEGAMRKEWWTILRSYAMGGSFVEWIANQPELGYPPWDLPSIAWLHTLCQLVKFNLDAHLASDANYAKSFRDLQREDKKTRSEARLELKHYQQVRGSVNSAVVDMHAPVEVECAVLRQVDDVTFVFEADPDQFQPCTPVMVADIKGWIIASQPDHVVVRFLEPPPAFDDHVRLCQDLMFTDPKEVVDQLNGYWLPIWQSDEHPTESQMQDFDRLVASLPIAVEPLEVRTDLSVQSQKQQWLEGVTLQCPFCPMEDSRWHRIHECPAFAELRAGYQSNLDWFQSEGIPVEELPLVHMHPDQEVHRMLQFRESDICVGDDFLHLAFDRRQDGIPLLLYTDGSGMFPRTASTRIAGVGVVVDLCVNDAQRRQFAAEFLMTGDAPASLQPLACGRLQGEQTVPRAELMALVVATRFSGEIHTFSDCQYALDVIDKLRMGTFDFLHGKDLDVIRLLQRQLTDQHVFHKIRAHQDLTSIQDLLQLYHALGNHLADVVAKQASFADFGDFSKALHARHNFVQTYRDHLLQHFQYIVQLHRERKSMEEGMNALQQQTERVECAMEPSALQVMSSYWPLMGETFDAASKLSAICQYFPWGSDIATLFADWYSHLRWPSGDGLPKPCRQGVTWLELGLSFSFHAAAALPIIRETSSGDKQLLKISTAYDCAAHGSTLHDFSFCMQTMWGHFTFVLDDTELPAVERGKTGVLMYLGYDGHAAGLMTRPCFPGQEAVLRYLHSHLKGKSNYSSLCTPPWLNDTRVWPFSATEWDGLRKSTYALRRDVKRRC
eukprot:Skav206299  [mRNA]  locus=scaffold3268:172305:176813:+ [translate_table: standard]